ncbi:MAG: porin family protein [Eudoraea sp.]|nr:porin family protein [Eudoraea sp.]
MKKPIIHCLFLLMFIPLATSLHAQSLSYGVKAGLNLNNLNISPEEDPPAPTLRPGIHIGGFLEYGLTESISVMPEVSVSTQGANDSDPEVDQRVKLTYLNIPVLVKYQLPMGVSLYAGPQIGILAGGEFEEEDKGSGEQEIYQAGDYYKGADLSLGFGAAYTLDMGIGVHIRYNLGLSDNNNDLQGNAFYEPNQTIKSQVLQASVHYYIGK